MYYNKLNNKIYENLAADMFPKKQLLHLHDKFWNDSYFSLLYLIGRLSFSFRKILLD